MLIKETSERSKQYNKAEKQVKSLLDLTQVEFEGISTKNNKITCLLDRGLINTSIDDFIKQKQYKQLINECEKHLSLKTKIAKKLQVPWLFVVYSYVDNKCVAFDLTKLFWKGQIFESFSAYGKWFSDFTDGTKRFSSYQESGLPKFDKELRANGTPWPGNIDGILFIADSKQMLCILEYQNTTATKVRYHDNNKYMQATPYRKGDNKRWMVQERLSNALGVSVIVVVWSLQETEIGLKSIKSFSIDNLGLVTKINWGPIEYLPYSELKSESFIKLLTRLHEE